MLICKNCGKPRELGRRLCKECRAASVRKRYKEKGRYNYGEGSCALCSDKIMLWRKDQKFCRNCRQVSTSSKGNVSNQYERAHGGGYSFMHRRMAETILKRILSNKETVHHLDENPNNNDPKNLIVISRSLHGKLHAFLRTQRAELAKANYENLGNCWDNLRVPMTTAWLETAGATVIKLWEIGQSAA